MNKHTPGPWTQRGETIVVDKHGTDYHYRTVCYINQSLPHVDANSRLISAAPEMLEALKIMTGLVRLKYGNLDKDVWEKTEEVRALLAKIEGGE